MNTHSDGPNRNAVTTAQPPAALVAPSIDCDDRLELGSFVVLCSAPRGHYQTHTYTTTADDGRSVTLEWDKPRCSSCGLPTDTLGCVPGPDGPSHTFAGNGGRPCAQGEQGV